MTLTSQLFGLTIFYFSNHQYGISTACESSIVIGSNDSLKADIEFSQYFNRICYCSQFLFIGHLTSAFCEQEINASSPIQFILTTELGIERTISEASRQLEIAIEMTIIMPYSLSFTFNSFIWLIYLFYTRYETLISESIKEKHNARERTQK